MVKAIKVMLTPNNVQQTKLFQYAGASRFAYNWALAREKENYEKGGRFIPDTELRKEFTRLRNSDEYAWLLNVSNNVLSRQLKMPAQLIKTFSRVYNDTQGLRRKRNQCLNSIKIISRYSFVIRMLNLKDFLSAGKLINKS